MLEKTKVWQLAELRCSRARAARKIFERAVFQDEFQRIFLRRVQLSHNNHLLQNSLACDGGFIDMNGPLHSAAQSKNKVL